MEEFGKDFLLDNGGDIIFYDDGNSPTVTGPALVAQDVKTQLKTRLGAVFWNRNTGSKIFDYLNRTDISGDTIKTELERVARKDPRVLAASVTSEEIEEGKFKLTFTTINSEQIELIKEI